tara:strand:+ start:54 stop:200 length:147 start_codon:yes stop_codon:yes gene_type:complete
VVTVTIVFLVLQVTLSLQQEVVVEVQDIKEVVTPLKVEDQEAQAVVEE